MNTPLNILALGASLRKGSYSQAVLKTLVELAPADLKIESFDFGTLPLYNQDLETPEYPASVQELHKAVAKADALLFVIPEYNYSVPGYVKNGLDWASRPSGTSAILGKKAAIVSSSPGMLGGARAQYHLRQSGVFLDINFLNKPEVMISAVNKKFDENLKLTDETTRGFLTKFLDAFGAFIRPSDE